MGAEGIGPTTSFLSGKRSTTELRTPFNELADFTMIYRLTARVMMSYNYVRSGERLSNMLQNQITIKPLFLHEPY